MAPSPATPSMTELVDVGGYRLGTHLAHPDLLLDSRPGVVLCHGFPVRGRESPASGLSFPELADRIARDLGWTALAFNFRGCGLSDGDFSVDAWWADIVAAARHVLAQGARRVWLVGFGTGGLLALRAAVEMKEVQGVASAAAPADLRDWARHPRQLLDESRRVGVVKTEGFPARFGDWAAELAIDAADAAQLLAPRPLLVLHGEMDDLVPNFDGRTIADAHGDAELRILPGGGHELRHDPRAVAILMGWLSRMNDDATLAQFTD
ncbi:MAG: alpha/beta fold hydrolase [Microthrixaceae bacterium]